jgi:IS30 family transposase
MPNKHKQLSIEERETIQAGLWAKKSIRNIAQELGRSPSTVSRELTRNALGPRPKYIPRLAQERARERVVKRGRRTRLKSEEIREYVKDMLKIHYSPEQIAGRIAHDVPGAKISYEAIYEYIYSQYRRSGYGRCIGEDLRVYLKRRHKARHPKYIPFRPQRLKIIGAISISERPKEIELRNEIGHWEGDSVVSGQNKHGLNTLVERKSGLLFATKIKNGTAQETSQAVINRLGVLPQKKRQTLTMDNGSENSGHKIITENLGTKCYFARPYHSWERGTNENTNGLIRYYFPKKTDFAKISEEEIKRVETILNNRPRKRLQWLTPLEVFNGQSVALKC